MGGRNMINDEHTAKSEAMMKNPLPSHLSNTRWSRRGLLHPRLTGMQPGLAKTGNRLLNG